MDMTVGSGSWHNWQQFYGVISLLALKKMTSIILDISFEFLFTILCNLLKYNYCSSQV